MPFGLVVLSLQAKPLGEATWCVLDSPANTRLLLGRHAHAIGRGGFSGSIVPLLCLGKMILNFLSLAGPGKKKMYFGTKEKL